MYKMCSGQFQFYSTIQSIVFLYVWQVNKSLSDFALLILIWPSQAYHIKARPPCQELTIRETFP